MTAHPPSENLISPDACADDAHRTALIDQLRSQHRAARGVVFNIIVTLIDVGGAILLFRVARDAGASELTAYLAGCIAPIIGAIVVWIKARKFSGASAAIFAFTALSAIIAVVGSSSPKILLYKDCGFHAIVGLIFIVSCLFGKPLVFHLAQRYSTDGTHEGMQVFDMMWDAYPRFRRAMYQISVIWGVVYLAQAIVTAVIIAGNSFDAAYAWNHVLPFVATGIAITLTIVIARRTQSAINAGQIS
ncbi:MAG: VC0807 family protein [Gordonia sp. (in: high G+C Gram-positive bacteria)]